MFPISDTSERDTFPIINYIIIIITVLVFLLQLSVPDFDNFVLLYGFVPSRFNILNLDSYKYILFSIFLHGGFLHIISNLWFLHIFGDNVEDRMGHLRYLLFYLAGGFAAVMMQYVFTMQSNLPMIGASGAISAVAGAYFVLLRNSKVKTLITYFFIWNIVEIPAWLFLGYWFFIQIFSSVGSLVSYDINQGGVAYFAHIGGFVFGYLIAKLYPKTYFSDNYI